MREVLVDVLGFGLQYHLLRPRFELELHDRRFVHVHDVRQGFVVMDGDCRKVGDRRDRRRGAE